MPRLTEFVSYFASWRRKRTAGNAIRVSPEAIASPHADGVVFLHSGKGELFSANRIGARIWRGLVERRPLDAVAAEIAGECGMAAEQVRQDAADFLTELEARGLVTVGAGR